MKVKPIDELDQMARDFINGEVKPLEISGLYLFDMWAVLTLASNYSLAKMGTVDPITCSAFKYHILRQYEQFKTPTVFLEKLYSRACARARNYSTKRTELTIALSAESVDMEQVLLLSMNLIDLLTGEDIYLKLFQRKFEDKMFKAHSMQAASKHIDEYYEKFGNKVPYAKLLERFYAATCEDKIAEMFIQLDPDGFRDKARRGIPVKKDKYKDIARSMDKMYVRGK